MSVVANSTLYVATDGNLVTAGPLTATCMSIFRVARSLKVTRCDFLARSHGGSTGIDVSSVVNADGFNR